MNCKRWAERFKLVLADSLYGESGCGFIDVLYEMSTYLLVSLHTNALHQPQVQSPIQRDAQPQAIALKLAQHPGWNRANGWKQALNNLRVVIQPSVIWNLLEPWLNLFPIPR